MSIANASTPRSSPVVRYGLVAVMLAAGLALLLATSIFGVGREGSLGSHDFRYFTSAGEAWLGGTSPYLLDDLNAAADSYYEDTPLEGTVEFDFVLFYPPQFFPIAAASGLLPYDASRYGVAFLTIVSSFAVGLVCLWCYRTERGVEGTLLGAFALGLAVSQTIGNPFASHNIWMGQTSVLATALMLGGWVLCCRGLSWFGAALIALGCFKPTLGVALVPLAVLRWPKQTLIVMPIVGLATAAYPLLTQGPITHTLEWLSAIGTYKEHPPNDPDFRHYFGLQSLIRSLGVPAPKLIFIAVPAVLALLMFRKRLSDQVQAAFAITIPICLYQGHDYDLMVLAPAIAILAARFSRSYVGIGLLAAGVVILFVPLRLVTDLDGPPVVARYREIVALILLGTLLLTTLRQRSREPESVEREPRRAGDDQPK
jgi:hypothetical protein